MDKPNNTDNTAGPPGDERASEWVDALMDEREREAFERELADDPELAAELERFEQTVEILRRMPQPSAPDDFLKAVQSRIRRRSRGRWYGFEQAKTRFPYEAAFNIVLIGILFALYLSSTNWGAPAKLVPPKFSNTPVQQVKNTVGADAVVGTPTVIEKTADGSLIELNVETTALPAVKEAIAGNADLEFVSERASESGRTMVRVRYKDRAPPGK